MAASIQLGILDYFSIIFPALLIFVIIYAILEKTELLGKNKVLHAVIGIAAAFLAMLSSEVIEIINFGAPWFVMVFVFLTLLLLIYFFMGASEQNLKNLITEDKPIQWAIFAIAVIIVIAAFAHVYGQRLLEQAPAEEGAEETAEGEAAETAAEDKTFRSEVFDTIFNPKVLGMLLIFLIAVFAVSLLTREAV